MVTDNIITESFEFVNRFLKSFFIFLKIFSLPIFTPKKAVFSLLRPKDKKIRSKSQRQLKRVFLTSREKLLGLGCLCNDLLTLVVTASLANTVCEDILTALRALNDVGGGSELPYAGTSLHLSCVRSFSLRYCHL